MTKTALVGGCFCAGIALCIWGNAAFAVLGVILGLGGVGAGIYIIITCFSAQKKSVWLGAALAGIGLLLVILCLFIEAVSFFMGGVILIAAGTGIFLLPKTKEESSIITPFAIGCALWGLIIIFTPAFAGWLSVLTGVALIVYGAVCLIFL